ncbi:MAG: hypothetical protein ABI284_05295 [Nitrosospira sp.]
MASRERHPDAKGVKGASLPPPEPDEADDPQHCTRSPSGFGIERS